jgi:hypothetical protein
LSSSDGQTSSQPEVAAGQTYGGSLVGAGETFVSGAGEPTIAEKSSRLLTAEQTERLTVETTPDLSLFANIVGQARAIIGQ